MLASRNIGAYGRSFGSDNCPDAASECSICSANLEPRWTLSRAWRNSDIASSLPVLIQGETEYVMSDRIVGLKPDCRAELGDRVLLLPLVS